jgi:hypothetical protein
MAAQLIHTVAEASQINSVPQDRIVVSIPDFFVHFAAKEPRVNKHYERIRDESVGWLCRSVVAHMQMLQIIAD